MADQIIVPAQGDMLGLGGNGIGALLIGALLGNGTGLFGGNRWGAGGAAAGAVATDVLLNPAFESLQSQINNLSSQLATGDIQDSISKLSSELGNVATAQASANFTTLSSINGLGRDLVTNIHQQDLTQLNSFNQLTTTTLQGFNSQAMQVQNATNQIIAQGTAMAAQNAQCCCEIKQTIKDDGNATRALINDLNVQNLTAQLNDAKNQISNSSQTNALVAAMAQQTNVLLQHLHPIVS